MQSPNLACPVAESATGPMGPRAMTMSEEDRHLGSRVQYNVITLVNRVQGTKRTSA